MKTSSCRVVSLYAILMFTACGDEEPRSPSGRGVQIAVAPLTLPDVEGVEYALAVFNAAPSNTMFAADGTVVGPANLAALVWNQPSVTSNQFGNAAGGDIAYVGPCDASAPSEQNWAAVVIRQIDVGDNGGSLSGIAPSPDFVGTANILDDEVTSVDLDPDFVNPCDHLAPCVLAFDCDENRDTQVVFNLTIMRDAEQGFFDIAVNFDDIFCSAKFDTCRDDIDGTEIDEAGYTQLLYFDRDGLGAGEAERWDTGVLALACTAGQGADTNLYMDTITIVCDGQDPIYLDPSQDEGGNVDAPPDQDIVFGFATYFGSEQLDCEAGVSCKKKYWNVAIGFATDLAHQLPDDCTLYASATASDGMFAGAWVTPPKTAYPVIRFAVPLTPVLGDSSVLQCGNWGVDEAPVVEGEVQDYVYTEYTSLDCQVDETGDFADGGEDDCDFCHRMNTTPDHPIEAARFECARSCGNDVCDRLNGETLANCPEDCQPFWSRTGTMAESRTFPMLIVLQDGKVLAAGGSGNGNAEVFDPATETWSNTGATGQRDYGSGTLLPSGKVLAAGGYGAGAMLASAELYDPSTGTWTATTPMSGVRMQHTATLLSSGKVLVTGGRNSQGVGRNSAEIYDPGTASWTPTGPLNTARFAHTATLLQSGKVLVVGNGNSLAWQLPEVYDPASNTWTSTPPSTEGHYQHAATLLPSGKVLITGNQFSKFVELYDPSTNTWAAGTPLIRERMGHSAVLLATGMVLVAGGQFDNGYTAELYDPATGAWALTASMFTRRRDHGGVLLPSGLFLAAGGSDLEAYKTCELYHP